MASFQKQVAHIQPAGLAAAPTSNLAFVAGRLPQFRN
jgi:hypothetical protein